MRGIIMQIHKSIQKGNLAVITGGANGIGLAAAKFLADNEMNVIIADINGPNLENSLSSLPSNVIGYQLDVTSNQAVTEFKDHVIEKYKRVDFLLNNAGVSRPTDGWNKYENWQTIISTNLWGVLNINHAFMPFMSTQTHPSILVTTGSKQGITSPPGNPAYNASKAAVKSIAEAMEHQLRNTAGNLVQSHLLVPGFTYTGMITSPEKPSNAWTSQQVVYLMMMNIIRKNFYIICPDNSVTREVDNKRMTWAMGDIIHNRPPLSRWHNDYEGEFLEFMNN
jgi:NADP-dependent 3-hydroxy acid dehydrogenase YdfG